MCGVWEWETSDLAAREESAEVTNSLLLLALRKIIFVEGLPAPAELFGGRIGVAQEDLGVSMRKRSSHWFGRKARYPVGLCLGCSGSCES